MSRASDGYSTSKQKRGGGIFRSEAVINFNYTEANRTLEEMKRTYADLARKIKASGNVKIQNEKALSDLNVAKEWRKTIKYRVRDIAVSTTAVMKEEILRGIGGRIETRTMKRSIRGRTNGNAEREESRAGWLDLWYKYFGFQEEGTKNGIKPMKAILRGLVRGRIYAAARLQKMVRNDLRSGGRGNVRRG